VDIDSVDGANANKIAQPLQGWANESGAAYPSSTNRRSVGNHNGRFLGEYAILTAPVFALPEGVTLPGNNDGLNLGRAKIRRHYLR
jgi:hypothetical protein